MVITIIVLLILAGVTINLVLGPEGLLKQAQDGTDRYKQTEKEETNNISNVVGKLDSINNVNGGEIGTPTDPGNQEKPVDPSTAKPGDIIKTENNIKYTSDGEENVIPVPVGFSYVGEGTKKIGFVIRNDVDLNEFVWVPVKDMPYTYDRYVFLASQSSIDGYLETIQADEHTSVNTYGGYYIARYEAGILTQRRSNTTPTEKPIFRKSTNQQKVYVYNYVTRDQAKSLADKLYNKTENNVTSKLCSSYAWDTALKFIETKNEGWVSNSTGGNYSTASGGTGQLQQTGYHSVNNIYDMGGNVNEWITETFSLTSSPCVNRGGYYNNTSSNNPAAYRAYYDINGSGNGVGLRVSLYL